MISKATIQYVRSLQDRKQRQKYGHFVVEGEKSITELLKSHYEIKSVFALEAAAETMRRINRKVRIEEISGAELRKLSVHQTPQKAVAVVEIPDPLPIDPKTKYILALDEIQDPGNLGTIIRIADWYGIKNVICGPGCADLYNPKCINSTMGSFLRVNVVYDSILDLSQKLKLPLIAAAFDGQNVHDSKLPEKGILLIGNEGHGINEFLMEAAEYKLTIPRYGKAESLNAAVSAAVILDNLVR